MILYFILLPVVFLINDFDVKSAIAESPSYEKILDTFNCNYTTSIVGNAENSADFNQIQNENESNATLTDGDNFGNVKRKAK